jgi:gliding motility-associatede transport system auxiliary component
MNGRLRRGLDWAGYVGIAVLVAGAILPFLGRPQWYSARWWVGGAGLVLVLASLVGRVGDLRLVFARRTARYGVNTAVMIVILVGIIGLVEAVSYRHNARLDLTENKRHSLSPQTIRLLKSLKTDVAAVAFFRSDQPGKRVAEDLFKQYARYGGGRFTWKVVDPDREPGLARRYGIESYGTVVLESKAKSEKVSDAEEEKLTNGLVKVMREGKRTVYVVQGHGEHDPANTERPGFSEAKSALERANYEVKPLVLPREGKIPDDAAVVIVAGPRTDLFPPELDALDGYLGRGGKLLLMTDPFQSEGLKRYLGKYGFELGDNLVIEPNPIGRLFGIGPEVPIVQQYESHPITRDMGGVTTLFPLTRTVETAKQPPPGLSVQTLARTSPQSWGETDRGEIQRGEVKPDPQDPKGPLSVAAVATKDKARIVVYGTSSLAANQFLNVQGNRDFFLNTVSWLAEEEDQIAIRPKDTKQTPVFLTSQQAQAAFLLPVIVLPGLVIVGGIVAVVRRRAET